ncbi:MAG: hypothetical protein GEU75_10455 [Dehalococcoidia bacterium]|nr:hypothetical protein [Dehalococcoidia bacterium]
MRAAGYIRVSTEEQAREGYSLAAQENAIRSYCAAMGWGLVEVYSDAGRSGGSTKGREGLAQLLAASTAGLIDRVIFSKLDRLARRLRDLLEISDRLETLGVGIVSIQEAIDTGSATGRMLRNMIGTVAEFERELIRERIVIGMGQKARQGEVVGPVSLGYRREDGKLLPDASAPRVLRLFELYGGGEYSLRRLADWAAGAGLTSTEGNHLDRLSVRKILLNPVYVGDVIYHPRGADRAVFPGSHPPIVTRQLFELVQEQLSRRRYAKPAATWGREAYPLTGVAICGHCGNALTGSRAGRRLRYLRCSSTARRGRSACRQPMVAAELVEEQIGAYVEGMRLPLEYVQAIIAELRELEDLADHREERARLQTRLDRWRRLYVAGDVDEQQYKAETAPLRQRVQAMAASEQPLDVERAMYYIRNTGRLWRESDRATQRDFVMRVFERIVVDGAQVTELTPKPDYAPLFAIDRKERFAGQMCVVWLPEPGENPNFLGAKHCRHASLILQALQGSGRVRVPRPRRVLSTTTGPGQISQTKA